MGGWVVGWVGGWVGEWMDGLSEVLTIAPHALHKFKAVGSEQRGCSS